MNDFFYPDQREAGGGDGGTFTPAGNPTPPTTAPPNVNSVRSPNDGVPQSGGRLWMRKWFLMIGPNSGTGLDLSQFDFEFSVSQAQNQPPWEARVKVWNLGEDTITRLANKEFTSIRLDAGYQSPSKQYGKLFNGMIVYFKQGRQSATDTFVEIFAATHDTALSAELVNTWLKQGWTTKDTINACMAVMGKHGIVLGQVPKDLDKKPQPRGRLVFGNPTDILRDVARTEDLQVFTDNDGKVHFLRRDEVLNLGSELVPKLNVDSGMIGTPTRLIDGAIEVTSLLNPNISPGRQIQVNNKETANLRSTGISEVKPVNVDLFPQDAYKLQEAAFIFKADGVYPIGSVRHEGQTRGNNWFSHIITQKALQLPAPPKTTLGG